MLRMWRAPALLAVALSVTLGLLATSAFPAMAVSAVVSDEIGTAGSADASSSGGAADDSTESDERLNPEAGDAAELSDADAELPPDDAGQTLPFASALGDPAAHSLVVMPDDSETPIGSGPELALTSAISPAGAVASGSTRTFTITYENEDSGPTTNARLWHQLMVDADHVTSFTVSCASTINGAAAGSCPAWVPSGQQDIPSGVAGDEYLSYAGIFTFQAHQKLIFTIAVTSTFAAGVCTEAGTATAGGWAGYSSKGFTIADLEESASSSGLLSGATVCAPGDITMTNTVTSPYDPSIPAAQGQAKVLSGGARVFSVTWKNVSGAVRNDVDLRYAYYIPSTGHVTQASWSCAVTGGSQPCPTGLTGSTTLTHNSPGDEADAVFTVADVDFPAAQEYTVTVTLTTTLNACSPDGTLGVQTFAYRAAIGSEVSERRTSSLAPLPIGCTSWMLNETFSNTAVADAGWKGLGQACLTAAPSGSNPSNGLGYCTQRNQSPTTNFQMPTGTQKGFLQLTDDQGNQVGAILYNRALPSTDGLVVEFTTYQYGNDASGADGIGFFLTDGAYELTATGGMGGALGYAYRDAATDGAEQGVAHGYLGVGLDVYGNYVNSSHVAPSCGNSSTAKSQSLGLRGPGDGRTGYCLLAQNRVSDIGLALDKPSAGITAGANYDTGVRSALTAAKRNVRVTVWPLKDGETNPRVTVEVQFPAENYYRTLVDTTMTSPSPALIKFGFMAATGGSREAHLLDAVRVGTVLQMKELNITKVVDYAANANPATTSFNVGDVVNYKFVVHNSTQATSGISTIYNVLVTDPLIPSISCPATQLDRLTSMTCTGALTVTEASRDAGRVRNTATVAGSISSDPNAPRNLTDADAVEVPVNPEADDALRVIAPSGTATFQVIKSGSTLGIVRPDDPIRLTLEVFNTTTSTWIPVPANGSTNVPGTYGTWRIHADRAVTFTHNGSANYTITPLTYRVTNIYGGWDTAQLKVTVSVSPNTVCVAADTSSERYWAFGTASKFDFGATGTTPIGSPIPGVASTHGSFTVTDSKGALQFVVDSSGRIRDRNGANMAGSSSIGTLTGASPSTVFPAGQGTGKFIVVVSSATTGGAGQLRYWTVDMTLNGGLGGVVGSATSFGSTNASMAVTSVPNADGSGYWVISSRRGSASIDAHRFTAAGYVSTVTTTNSMGSADSARTTNYEDIRFNAALSRIALLASNNDSGIFSSGTNRVRLMSFNAATGVPALVDESTFSRSRSVHGYGIEFSPNGEYLYASRIGTGGTAGSLYRAAVGSNSLGNFDTSVAAPNSNLGGAVRAGPDGRLYWAQTGDDQIRVVNNPNGGSTTTVLRSLATGAASTYGLSNTLTDCAIPPAEFHLVKLNSDGVPMGGAAFALFADVSGSPSPTALTSGITAISGQTGKYRATGIAPGSYWIRETTALPGHSLLPSDVLITVQLGGVVQLDSLPNPQVRLLPVGSDGIYTLEITNDPALALPRAGGIGTTWFIAGGGTLVLIALLGAWWWRRRRDSRT